MDPLNPDLPTPGTYRAEFHGPEQVTRRCEHSGREPEEIEMRDFGSGMRRFAPRSHTFVADGHGICPMCRGEVVLTSKGRLGAHARILSIRDQAQHHVDAIAVALGFERMDDDVLLASSAARDHRSGNVDLAVAAGLGNIIVALTKRGVASEAASAMATLAAYVSPAAVRQARAAGVTSGVYDDAEDAAADVPDDAPLLTEAVLYPLLGKDEARSVLSLTGAVTATVGRPAR